MATLTIKNEDREELAVWLEPWCRPYKVRRGSVLGLSYTAFEALPLETELTEEGLTIYLNAEFDPTVTLDGEAAVPAWE